MGLLQKNKGQRSEGKRCQNTFGFHKFNNIEDTNNGKAYIERLEACMLQLPLRRERKLEVNGHEAPASNLYSASDHPLTWWIYAETHCDAAWRRPHIVRLRRQRTQSQRYKWHGVEIRFEYGAMVIWADLLLFVSTVICLCE